MFTNQSGKIDKLHCFKTSPDLYETLIEKVLLLLSRSLFWFVCLCNMLFTRANLVCSKKNNVWNRKIVYPFRFDQCTSANYHNHIDSNLLITVYISPFASGLYSCSAGGKWEANAHLSIRSSKCYYASMLSSLTIRIDREEEEGFSCSTSWAFIRWSN